MRRFPDEVLAGIREQAEAVLAEEAEADPIFKEAYESLTAYMDRVGEWEALQAIPKK